jgi:hypothetical protein
VPVMMMRRRRRRRRRSYLSYTSGAKRAVT